MNFKVLWSKYSLLLIVLAALLAGCAWGFALAPQPPSTPTPYPTYTPYPTATPLAWPDEARLFVRVDNRDGVTGEPVRGLVALTTYKGYDDTDIVIAKDTSLVEFPLPKQDEVDRVILKVQAKGYRLWALEFDYQVVSNQLFSVPVMLERLNYTVK